MAPSPDELLDDELLEDVLIELDDVLIELLEELDDVLIELELEELDEVLIELLDIELLDEVLIELDDVLIELLELDDVLIELLDEVLIELLEELDDVLIELAEELEVDTDDVLIELELDDRSSIERTCNLPPRFGVGPGNCKLPVLKCVSSTRDTSPDVLVSTRETLQISLSGRIWVVFSVAPARFTCTCSAGGVSSPDLVIRTITILRLLSETAGPK